MTVFGHIEVPEGDVPRAVRSFLGKVLALDDIEALLVPCRSAANGSVMPALVSDPGELDQADPLAPFFPLNAAVLAARLTRKPSGRKVAAVLRPCETRAFIELVKLKQGRLDDLLLIGLDCPGAYRNADAHRLRGQSGPCTMEFLQTALADPPFTGSDTQKGAGQAMEPALACQTCEYFTPDQADIALLLFGVEPGRLVVHGRTPRGGDLLDRLGVEPAEAPAGREAVVAARRDRRIERRDRMFSETRGAVDSLEKLAGYLADCVNCGNCRVACPVCYCRECVFKTDVFDHEGGQYLKWARRKGALRMPTDTVFFHMTRLAHMSTACVGCGQCSNACPNDVPVMPLFRTVAAAVQKAFEYVPGRDSNEAPPLSVFREDE